MMICIIEKKPELWSHLVDMGKGNKLAFQDWEDMVTEIVEPSLPWKEAAKEWSICGEDGTVDVANFLSRWIVTIDSEEYNAFLIKAVKCVFEAILALDMDLEHTLLLFDVDGDGTVELKELRQVLGMFDLGLTSTQLDRLTGQIFHHCTTIAEDGGHNKMCAESTKGGVAKLNVQEFLKHLTVVYKQTVGDSSDSESTAWAFEALDKIGRLIMKTPQDELISEMDLAAKKIQSIFRGKAARKEMDTYKSEGGEKPHSHTSSLPVTRTVTVASQADGGGDLSGCDKLVNLFASFDINGDGCLQIEEFVNGIEKVPKIRDIQLKDGRKLDHATLLEMSTIIDVGGNGTINYLEFLQAFSNEEGTADIAETVGEDITTVLFRHRHAIRMGCHYFDEVGAGKILAENFKTVLVGVNSALSRPERNLTTTQIALLVDAMSSEAAKMAEAAGVPLSEPMVDYVFFLRAFVVKDKQNGLAIVKKFA